MIQVGYYATGGGYVSFSSDISDELFKAYGDVLDEVFDCVDEMPHGKGFELSYDGKYYGDDVSKVLGIISSASRVTDGEIEFVGEDNCHWRFVWQNGKWEEQNGVVTYEGDSGTPAAPPAQEQPRTVWVVLRNGILVYVCDSKETAEMYVDVSSYVLEESGYNISEWRVATA